MFVTGRFYSVEEDELHNGKKRYLRGDVSYLAGQEKSKPPNVQMGDRVAYYTYDNGDRFGPKAIIVNYWPYKVNYRNYDKQ